MKELQSYVKEIETQAQKPLEEQLNDVKIAGAKLLQIIDNLIPLVDNVVEALDRESNNKEKEPEGISASADMPD